MNWLGNILAMLIVVSLMIAACTDIAIRIIPNSIPAIIAVIGITLRLLISPSAAAISVTAATILFVLLLILHARGMLGGGDVKLIPAIALGLSLPSITNFVYVTVMSGGALAAFHLLARWMLRKRPPSAPPPKGASLLRRVFYVERWRIARHGSLPYGVAIACGGIWVIMSKAGS